MKEWIPVSIVWHHVIACETGHVYVEFQSFSIRNYFILFPLEQYSSRVKISF